MNQLMAVIALACLLLSALLTPCASLRNIQVRSSYKQAENKQVLQPSLPTFPRRPRINEEVSVVGRAISDSKSNNKQKEDALGDNHQNKELKAVEVMHGSKELTRQEWSAMEGTDDESNDLFTMDYSQVRRRRPIHNKSVPVRP